MKKKRPNEISHSFATYVYFNDNKLISESGEQLFKFRKLPNTVHNPIKHGQGRPLGGQFEFPR